jgi:hypothetical protein
VILLYTSHHLHAHIILYIYLYASRPQIVFAITLRVRRVETHVDVLPRGDGRILLWSIFRPRSRKTINRAIDIRAAELQAGDIST